MRQWTRWVFGLTCLAMVVGTGCGLRNIRDQKLYEDQDGFRIGDDADIRDTTRNRKILNVVAQYQQAVTNKNLETLRRLVSDDYYDNAGTTDTTEDDYGTKQFLEFWEQIAKYSESIKYNITVRKIDEKRGRVAVKYEYKYAFKVAVGENPEWDAGVNVNKLELVGTDGNWKIVSGM